MFAKRFIKTCISTFGYEVRRVTGEKRDPFRDMQRLSPSRTPLILDIGANVGQTIKRFREHFDQPTIHSFEPSKDTFRRLESETRGTPNLILVNAALGSRREKRVFIENSDTFMSSMLEPGCDCWGSVVARREIELQTADDYCAAAGIKQVDILKSDTQGFDLEVLKGSEQILHQTALVYIELIFSHQYEGLPRSDEIFAFLADHGFAVVSFYDLHYQNGLLSWTDALFLNNSFARG